MSDYAHSETDKRIAELEKRLSEEYKQAYKETKDKLEKYLNDFKRKDEKKRQEVENGTLSEKDYKTWRRNQMLTGQRWADMVDTLAKDMNNVNVIAAQIVSGEMPEAFSLNANYSAYEIENGYRQNYGFKPYDRDTVDRLVSENPDLLPEPSVDIPADLRWNKQKIVSNITQAVLQGKSIPEIAKSMETVVGMNKASAVRNARTAMTGAQNAGRQQAYERAAAMGIKLQKEWIATLDGRTRHSHGMADGQKVDINGMFSVGGCKMRYPGDVQNGTAAEIYNCRCTMCTVEPPEIMQGEEPRMTYSEWVQTKEGQEALEKARIDRNKKAAKRRKAENKQQNNAQKPLDNGGGKIAPKNPIISEKSSKDKQNIFRTKSELDQMPLLQLRNETAELARTWYESGKSGISFGGSNIDTVVNKLVDGSSRNSLTKDYMSLKKRISTLDNNGGSGIMNTTTNAVGHTVIITDKNSLKGPPNGITQTTNYKGGIDRNYYDSNGDQTKQITNHDHSHKVESKFGKHGEHAHDYAFNDEGKNVHGKPRELSDEERKENADIL